MNKVFNINLGGYPFTIDEDAYQYLRTYLDAIHRHFKKTEGYEEITHDIETRLAELFLEQLGSHPIVSIPTVKGAINIMGRPEDFGAEPIDTDTTGDDADNTSGTGFKIKTGKRLFRDPEEQVIGGVAAGLAAYLGIPDPIWVRLFFVLVFFSGGIGIPFYIILWIIMPEAKNSGDRLSMRGEPINISNISKIITEEFEHLSEKMTEFGEELSGKKKVHKENDEDKQGFAQRFSSVSENVQDVMKDISGRLPNIGGLLRTVLIIVGIFFIAIFTLVWFGIIAGVTFSAPFLTNFFPGKESLTIILMINLLFVVGIPLVAIIISTIRLVWKRRMGRAWKTTLAVLWLVNGVSLIAIGGTLAQEFVTEDKIEQILPLDSITETFTLTYYTPDNYNSNQHYIGGKKVHLPGAPVRYTVKKSTEQSWQLNQIVSSRGKRGKEARGLAWEIELPLKIKEGNIASPREVPFSELSKWRNQKIILELIMPVGKFVRLNSDICNQTSGISVDIHPENGTNLYQMSASGKLICQDCTGIDRTESSMDTSSSSVLEQETTIQSFDKIHLSGFMKATIKQGETHSLRIIGNDRDLKQIKKTQQDDLLSISIGIKQTETPVRVFITTPSLKALNVTATDDVLLDGFTMEVLDINASGDFELKAEITVQELNLIATDGVEIEFTGEATLLHAKLTDGSRLDTDRGRVKDISLQLKDNSKVKLGKSVHIINQDAEEGSIRIVN